MSDLVLKMYGTIAGAESVIFSLDGDNNIKVALTEAPHGTAPSLQGKNIANPMAMILAGAAMLRYVRTDEATTASRAIYESVMEAVYDGIKTPDLRGNSSTTEFTDEVIRRVKAKLEIWEALGD
jgi:isocitrate/isopropylmalate dehydrogenase